MTEAVDRLYGFNAYREVVQTVDIRNTQEQLQAGFGDAVTPLDLTAALRPVPVFSRGFTAALVHEVLTQDSTDTTAQGVVNRVAECADIKRRPQATLSLDVFHLSLNSADDTVYTISLSPRHETDIVELVEDRRDIVRAAYNEQSSKDSSLGFIKSMKRVADLELPVRVPVATVRGAHMAEEIKGCKPMRAIVVPLGRLTITR
jgi:hypothetical protein